MFSFQKRFLRRFGGDIYDSHTISTVLVLLFFGVYRVCQDNVLVTECTLFIAPHTGPESKATLRLSSSLCSSSSLCHFVLGFSLLAFVLSSARSQLFYFGLSVHQSFPLSLFHPVFSPHFLSPLRVSFYVYLHLAFVPSFFCLPASLLDHP